MQIMMNHSPKPKFCIRKYFASVKNGNMNDVNIQSKIIGRVNQSETKSEKTVYFRVALNSRMRFFVIFENWLGWGQKIGYGEL